MSKNMLYHNSQTGEDKLVSLEEVIHTIKAFDRLIDIDNTVDISDIRNYKPQRKFSMFVRDGKRVYAFA
jgi:hypothetical protein